MVAFITPHCLKSWVSFALLAYLLKGNWVCLIHRCWLTNTFRVQHFSVNGECLCNRLCLAVKFASRTGISMQWTDLNETMPHLFFVLPFSISIWEADLPSNTGLVKKLLGEKGKLNRTGVCLGLLPGLFYTQNVRMPLSPGNFTTQNAGPERALITTGLQSSYSEKCRWLQKLYQKSSCLPWK